MFLFVSLRVCVCGHHRLALTGPPVAPSCSLTLTMSMGWIRQVAPMPARPPLA